MGRWVGTGHGELQSGRESWQGERPLLPLPRILAQNPLPFFQRVAETNPTCSVLLKPSFLHQDSALLKFSSHTLLIIFQGDREHARLAPLADRAHMLFRYKHESRYVTVKL